MPVIVASYSLIVVFVIVSGGVASGALKRNKFRNKTLRNFPTRFVTFCIFVFVTLVLVFWLL